MAFDPNNPAASGMVLTFDDEFTSSNGQFAADNVASNTKWSTHVWWQSAPSQFGGSVHDGVLDLAPGTEINTINSAGQGWGQKFGYFEARIKLVASNDVQEGFFMMSQAHAQSGPAPASELDIVETPTGDPTNILNTLHLDSAHAGDQQNSATGGNPYVNVGVDVTAGFHTYSALWDPNSQSMTWYFDGKQTMVQPKYATTDGAAMFMDLINTSGTNHMYVDYVRAWQFSDQNPTAVTPDSISAPFGQTVANGSSLPGGTPTPPPAPDPSLPASADGTTVAGTSGQIVSDAHNVFAINAAGHITENGAVLTETAQVTELAYLNHTLYQEATAQNQWWSFNETTHAWTQTSNPLPASGSTTPPAPAPATSADGTTVTGTSGQIVSDAHNVFAINAAGHITENGAAMTGTAQVTELAYLNHTLYQEATAQNQWWSFNETTNAWTPTSNPLSASGSTTPPLTPSFTDSAGHEIFVFNTLTPSGSHIANFDANADILDLAPGLAAAGYKGTDPLADHVITLAQSGTNSTAVMFDPTGHDPSHGATVVTLDHVLPQNVPAADLWH